MSEDVLETESAFIVHPNNSPISKDSIPPQSQPESDVNNKKNADLQTELREGSSYNLRQRRTLSANWGILSEEGHLLVTRSQVDGSSPTGVRSCSVLVDKQIPYYTSGFFYSVSPTSIPWVTDGDAGTSTSVTNQIRKPEKAISVTEFLERSNRGELRQEYDELF